jgi:hypothetical protein
MTAVSLKNSKADRSADSAERSGAALAEVISNGKNNMPPFQGQLKPGSNPRLGYPSAPQ